MITKRDIKVLDGLKLEPAVELKVDRFGVPKILIAMSGVTSVTATNHQCLAPILSGIEVHGHVWSMWKKNTNGEYCCVIDSIRHIIVTGKTPLDAALKALAAVVRKSK